MKSEARILIVGRDEMLLQTRKLILGTFFQVETAGRVSHALGILTNQKFDLIVLCYSLTEEEGRKVIDKLALQTPKPMVLEMSALGHTAVSAGNYPILTAEEGPYALVKKAAEMLGVELKSAGRANGAGNRRSLKPAELESTA